MSDRDVAAPAGVIYDLGYKRYVGTRRPQNTRWGVITRNLLAYAWKRWFRYKVWLGIAFVITVAVGVIMVVARDESLGELRRAEVVVRLVDGIVFGSIAFYTKVAFLLTLTVGIGVVASDLRTGAFTFYFARPVRPVDYVAGKLVGLTILHASVILVPMVVITLIRLGLSESTDELVDNLAFVPKAFIVGGLGSLTFAAVSLGFSSLLSSRWLNLAIWAGFYLILTSIVAGIAAVTDVDALAYVDIGHSLGTLSFALFDVEVIGGRGDASVWPPVVALATYSVAGAALAYLRVRAAAYQGIGGGS